MQFLLYVSDKREWYLQRILSPGILHTVHNDLVHLHSEIVYLVDINCSLLKDGFCYTDILCADDLHEVLQFNQKSALLGSVLNDDSGERQLSTQMDDGCKFRFVDLVHDNSGIVLTVLSKPSSEDLEVLLEKLDFEEQDICTSDLRAAKEAWDNIEAEEEDVALHNSVNRSVNDVLEQRKSIGYRRNRKLRRTRCVYSFIVVLWYRNVFMDLFEAGPFEQITSIDLHKFGEDHYVFLGTLSCLNGCIPSVGRLLVFWITVFQKSKNEPIMKLVLSFDQRGMNAVKNLTIFPNAKWIAFSRGNALYVEEIMRNTSTGEIHVEGGSLEYVVDTIRKIEFVDPYILITTLNKGIVCYKFLTDEQILSTFMYAANTSFCSLLRVAFSPIPYNRFVKYSDANISVSKNGDMYIFTVDEFGNFSCYLLLHEAGAITSLELQLCFVYAISDSELRFVSIDESDKKLIACKTGELLSFEIREGHSGPSLFDNYAVTSNILRDLLNADAKEQFILTWAK